ncbi:hypothetical protein PpBr36_07001 [Pyricularia pennisetigena]|uniref:hypothetical protein n=1 Tax=Pyricularia pennisetigena TaxID=1578925 RepID=UPI0011532170|nr:hypothetical protein PpBr36_07001 [Pyricularia pennisetigena]TLS25743.1 hypothetical protein PpBr36_07001 [Pyricularia pennisetigena]
MTTATRLPSTRRLFTCLGTSVLFFLPSANGSLSLEPFAQDATAAHAPDVILDKPAAAVAENVVASHRRRRPERDENETKNEVVEALGHQRIQAYRRWSVGDIDTLSSSTQDEEKASPAVAADPLITPAPELPPCLSGRNSLGRRQNDGQVQQLRQQLEQVSQESRSVSQQSQQLSQQVQQLAQSTSRLSQELQRAQDQARQAQESARQSSEQARQNADQARQASEQARQAQDQASRASESASAAQRSADSAVSIARESISSSAAAQIASNLASATASAASSAASIIAAARQSANQLMDQAASQVSVARAEATSARAEASTQISQAQGAAVSVTQAALAVVGTFIGSSLISILAFYLILRYRRNRLAKDEQKRPPISYPHSFRKEASGLGEAYGSTDNLVDRRGYDNNGYLNDVKEKPYKPASAAVGGRDKVGNPLQRSSSNYGDPPVTIDHNTPGARFSLFPKPSVQSPVEPTSNPNGGPASAIPNLDTWLRAGQVSPFGTLVKPAPAATAPVSAAQKNSASAWPLGGAAAADSGRTGPVMKPGNKLPFREN